MELKYRTEQIQQLSEAIKAEQWWHTSPETPSQNSGTSHSPSSSRHIWLFGCTWQRTISHRKWYYYHYIIHSVMLFIWSAIQHDHFAETQTLLCLRHHARNVITVNSNSTDGFRSNNNQNWLSGCWQRSSLNITKQDQTQQQVFRDRPTT